jgi:glycosyltransferase involved in cell wall biosynthesis
MPWVYRRLGTFVLLTEQMNPVVNSGGKPHIVMEGLVDIGMRSSKNLLEDKAEHPTVLYAGALRKQYGLENLILGFEALEDPRVRLEIYGEGDYVPDIERAAARDGRISYGGIVPNKEVVEREKRAWVLVNPRPSNQEFTRYSFPSKNMEYMVSGTPVVTTRLAGMPEEYYEYVSTIDGDDSQAIKDALSRELGRDPGELHAQGERARAFVLAKKNNVAQAARILKAMEQS